MDITESTCICTINYNLTKHKTNGPFSTMTLLHMKVFGHKCMLIRYLYNHNGKTLLKKVLSFPR